MVLEIHGQVKPVGRIEKTAPGPIAWLTPGVPDIFPLFTGFSSC